MIRETTDFTIHDFRMQTKSTKGYTMSSHHFHEIYEIYYLNEGLRDYFIGDTTYRVKEGDLVLVKPHDIHKTIDTGVSHSRLLISFRPEFLPFYDRDLLIGLCFSQSRILSLDLKEQQTLEDHLRTMVMTSKQQDPFFISQLQSQLFKLLMLASAYIKINESKLVSNVTSNDKVYDIIHYLKQHYNQTILLEDLADEFFISRYYMTRLFKKNTGFTIIEYLHSVRVVEAQKLLKETKLKIIDIAQQVGFTNVSSFGKVFKSITGSNPTEYRKQQK